jgi:hypothetical protein
MFADWAHVQSAAPQPRVPRSPADASPGRPDRPQGRRSRGDRRCDPLPGRQVPARILLEHAAASGGGAYRWPPGSVPWRTRSGRRLRFGRRRLAPGISADLHHRHPCGPQPLAPRPARARSPSLTGATRRRGRRRPPPPRCRGPRCRRTGRRARPNRAAARSTCPSPVRARRAHGSRRRCLSPRYG